MEQKVMNLKVAVLILSIATMFFYSINCSGDGIISIREEYKYIDNGQNIQVKSYSLILKSIKNEVQLQNLFKSKKNKGWFLQAGHKGGLKFIFSEPQYLKAVDVVVVFPSDQTFKKFKFNKTNISVGLFKEDGEFFGDELVYIVNKNINPQIIALNNCLYAQVLRVKVVTLEIDDNFANDLEGLLLKNIAFHFSEKPSFISSMTVSEIQTRFVKNKEKWKIFDDDTIYSDEKSRRNSKNKHEVLTNKVLINLCYWALSGDNMAEKILYDYSPTGTHDDEKRESIIRWYETDKAYNNKKKQNPK